MRHHFQWGALDPDEAIPEFIAELEAAGIRTIHEEAQRQLDEYLANQKIKIQSEQTKKGQTVLALSLWF